MPHDPLLDDPLWHPRPIAPDPGGGLIAPVFGDRQGIERPCRKCGATVQQAVIHGRPRLVIDVEGPIDPERVSARWPAYWWDPRLGWLDRYVRNRPLPLFVMHPCMSSSPVPPAQPEGTPRTMTSPFGTPKPAGSTGPSAEELSGKLLLLNVSGIDRGIDTIHGKADAVRCAIVELDTGQEHDDALLFSKTLTNQLVPGTLYLGWLSKDDIGGGKTAWHFNDSATDPSAVEKATQYLAYKAGQTPAPAGAFTPPPAAAPAAAAGAAAGAAPPWAK